MSIRRNTPPAHNGQKSATRQLNNAGEIRYRIRFLRVTFGDCLNLWPTYAREEYAELRRRLRHLESGRR